MSDLFGTDLFDPAPDDPAAVPGALPAGGAPAVPLAVRMRPRSLDELVGQDHLLMPGSPLRLLAATDADGGTGRAGPSSVVLWGPPGTGKTTLAHIVSRAAGHRFVELSAVTSGVKDVRTVMEAARADLTLHRRRTVLFIDEIHRFSKAQQDALLPGVENRWVVLVAATTENPSFSVVAPLLSRSLLLTLRALGDDDVRVLLRRAVADARGLAGTVELDPEAEDHLVRMAGGDVRSALTLLEAAAGAAYAAAGPDRADAAPAPAGGTGPGAADGAGAPAPRRRPVVTVQVAAQAVNRAVVRYDRDGDQHYDVVSAFIKSIRGSDVDAALHYLARMVHAGEDPRFIARRLMVHASEDIGMADPTALLTAVAAAQAVQLVGWPEARIVLAQAVVHLATAPKSNAVVVAIGEAEADVARGLAGPVPVHLRDGHYPGAKLLGHGQGYRYSHDDPRGVVGQQYAPDGLVGRDYYRPTDRGGERRLAERLARLRAVLRTPSRGAR